MSSTTTDILESLLEPVGEALSPEIARRIIAFRASPSVQERLDYLADRCTEGLLTAEERADYESLVATIDLISVLQSKAHAYLAAHPKG